MLFDHPIDTYSRFLAVGSYESRLAVETTHRFIDQREAGSLKDPA